MSKTSDFEKIIRSYGFDDTDVRDIKTACKEAGLRFIPFGKKTGYTISQIEEIDLGEG